MDVFAGRGRRGRAGRLRLPGRRLARVLARRRVALLPGPNGATRYLVGTLRHRARLQADPQARPRDGARRRGHDGPGRAAGADLERRRDRTRTVARRTLARLRAAHPRRDDLAQGAALRSPHRALAARPRDRGGARADGPDRGRHGRGHEGLARSPRLRVVARQPLDRDPGRREDPPGRCRERRRVHHRVHGAGASRDLGDGRPASGAARHDLHGEVPALDRLVPRREPSRLPGRGPDLDDGPAGRHPHPPHRRLLRPLRDRARLVAGRPRHRLHGLGAERARPRLARVGRRRHPRAAHHPRRRVHEHGVEPRRRRDRGHPGRGRDQPRPHGGQQRVLRVRGRAGVRRRGPAPSPRWRAPTPAAAR